MKNIKNKNQEIEIQDKTCVLALSWECFKTQFDPKKLNNYNDTKERIESALQIKNAIKDLLDIKDKFRVTYKKDKPYIIIKGKMAGIRKYVRGVRYKGFSLTHVTMGIAKSNIKKSITKRAALLTVLVNIHDNIMEHLSKKQWFWSDFLADTGVDILKDFANLGISAGAGWLTASLLSSAAVAGTAIPVVVGGTILPIVVVVGVGYGINILMEDLIIKYKIKEKLSEAIENSTAPIRELKREFDYKMNLQLNRFEQKIYRLYRVPIY